MMRCTAERTLSLTQVDVPALSDEDVASLAKGGGLRCRRSIGHGGLHHYLIGEKIQEFPDSWAVFPLTTLEPEA